MNSVLSLVTDLALMFTNIWPSKTQSAIYHGLHHVSLGVTESLDSVEDIHHAVVTNHLHYHGASTECATAPTSIPERHTVTHILFIPL